MSKLSVACGRSTFESEQCCLGVHQMRIAGTNCYLPTLPNNLYPATARLRGIVTDEAPGGHWVEARWWLAHRSGASWSSNLSRDRFANRRQKS